MECIDKVLGQSLICDEFYLNEGDILDYSWQNTVFEGAKVAGGSMIDSSFEDCTFRNTTFENIFMDDIDFVRCHFENFRIINCSRDCMEMRECTGSPPTMIGTKEGPAGWREKTTYPPGWEPSVK